MGKIQQQRQQERLARSAKRKKINTRPEKLSFLIVCEGEQTEPQYFRSFIANNKISQVIDVQIKGMGESTHRLIKEAKAFNQQRIRQNGIGYDHIWLVFDKDDNEDFDKTIQQATREDMKCAWTNNAFELWYCLHFIFLQNAVSRAQYISIIDREIRKHIPAFQYEKSTPNMYSILQQYGSEYQAIQNAINLEKIHAGKRPSQSEPATRVHRLIEMLRSAGN